MFLVSSSAFDQTILEDRVTNRLVESVNIFDTIVNNRCFRSVSVILFFNKTDLLVEKIKTKRVSDYFTDFQVRGASRMHIKDYLRPEVVFSGGHDVFKWTLKTNR